MNKYDSSIWTAFFLLNGQFFLSIIRMIAEQMEILLDNFIHDQNIFNLLDEIVKEANIQIVHCPANGTRPDKIEKIACQKRLHNVKKKRVSAFLRKTHTPALLLLLD